MANDLPPAAAVAPDALFTIDQIDEAARAFERNELGDWGRRTLALPGWFDPAIDPASPAFRSQMLRLWEAVTARADYDPAEHEDAPDVADLDAVRRPAFYAGGDTYFAGGQLMAMGHILMRSGIKPGDRILEYGAGFAQTALAFARLGAKVDTVDVNPAFCRAVQSIGDHYAVDLTAHLGQFGDNPAGVDNAYDLIFFYESFHHCLDFEAVIAKLKTLLKPNGRVILAGEPVFHALCPALPYPWGIRLDGENIAVMRIRGWMELGFQSDYLLGKFADAGFDCTLHSDPNSHWAQIYEFRRSRRISFHGVNMDMREGVAWAYRLLLNREASKEEIESLSVADGPAKLRSIMISSGQFKTLMERAGRAFASDLPLDFREGVIWAYRLLLQREPGPDEIEAHLRPNDTVSALRLRFTLSREFELTAGDAAPLIDFSIVNAFAPFKRPEPIEGSIRDFLGTSTSVHYFPQEMHHLSGRTDNNIPTPSTTFIHGAAEWVGTLRSVVEAGERFTAVELGAGWAPWLVASARAAELRGIGDIRLVGVEASEEHFSFMRRHFEANGLDPDKAELHRAIVAPNDGWAEFPKLHVGAEDYGANAVFDAEEKDRAATRGELEKVRAISLTTLLAKHDRVDLIHIDIQGHEEPVIRSALPVLNQKVRRMVIGTHSRSIEGHLLELLSQDGWICEFEQPCKLIPGANGELILYVDGEQVWRNTRIPVHG